jgi:hypothetical protein
MNANTSVHKYIDRFGDNPGSTPTLDAEDLEDRGAYGFLRGVRDKSQMLELRKKSGNIRAIGYGWIEKVDFDPSSGLTLYCGAETIRIKGRNLNGVGGHPISLLGGIIRHRVPWIAESDQSSVLTADKETAVVEKIEW